jgi:5-methylcytosine-specific restriction endonuclease McrA
METLAEYSIYEILPLIGTLDKIHLLDWKVNIVSERLKTFKRSRMCVECGLTGVVFKLQRHHPKEVPHLNLFAIDNNSDDVLMTADHIIPKSMGGPRELFNLQTMCHRCNEKKANVIILKYLTPDTINYLRNNI